MVQIKTHEDMMTFTKNLSVDVSYSSYVADYFSHLMKTFSDGEASSDFSLEDTGHIIILEASDAVITCLNEFGIPNIFKAPIEYCNLIELHDETGMSLSLYQVFMLFDNEYCMTLFVDSSILSPEIIVFFNDLV